MGTFFELLHFFVIELPLQQFGKRGLVPDEIPLESKEATSLSRSAGPT
jgi:hypothetical protein